MELIKKVQKKFTQIYNDNMEEIIWRKIILFEAMDTWRA